MTWYRKLYVGKLISSRVTELRRRIEKGEYPPGIWLITIAGNPQNQLELYRASELSNPVAAGHVQMIVGLAFSREEALVLLEQIAKDALDSDGSADMRAFLLREEAKAG